MVIRNQYPGHDAKLTNSFHRRLFCGVDLPKTAEEALAELKAGNQRYATGTHLHHHYRSERAELAASQHPNR